MNMQQKSLSELRENYELELEKALGVIKKQKSRKVLLQFPDGLKPYAIEIQKELESKTKNTEFFIWLDSCFGACDLPLETEKLGIDLIVQFGHSAWDYSSKKEFKITNI